MDERQRPDDVFVALMRLKGLCGAPLREDDLIVAQWVLGPDAQDKAVTVALVTHSHHKHYLAATLVRENRGWAIDHLAQTVNEQNVPRVAPALFVDARAIVVAGWVTPPTTRDLVIELHGNRYTAPVTDGTVAVRLVRGPRATHSSRAALTYRDAGGASIRVLQLTPEGGVETREEARRSV